MKQYFLGLDGGGTKTHILLHEPSTGLMDLYTGPGSNYEGMPGLYVELEQVLKQMFDEFLGKHEIKPHDIKNAAFGMSGVDTKKQHIEITKVLTRLGFTNFKLDNDAILGVKAGTSRGVGVSCVNGSGFSVIGVGEDDATLQTGGMGHFTGDYGGAFYVVPEAMNYVHGELFRRYDASVITQGVMEYLEITSKFDYMEAVHAKFFNGDQKAFRLAVCKIVFAAAAQNDAAAVKILERSGRAYAENILGVLDNLKINAPAEIVLTGSLFQKYPDSVKVAKIDALLKTHYGKPFEIKILDTPSVLGALFWAMGAKGNVLKDVRDGLRDKMKGLY